jgi:electron transfer flavoprotein beta subunit
MMRAIVLLSDGQPGLRGRARRARFDAIATEVALRSCDEVIGLHAGPTEAAALRLYGGMGLKAVRHVRMAADRDILPALAETIHALQGALVLAGIRSERATCSGLLPHALAQHLGWPLLAEVADLTVNGAQLEATQRLGRGMVRRLSAGVPAVITVGAAGPVPRQPAFARCRDTRVEVVAGGDLAPRVAECRQRLRAAAPPRPALASLGDVAGGITRPRALDGAREISAADAARLLMQALLERGFGVAEQDPREGSP